MAIIQKILVDKKDKKAFTLQFENGNQVTIHEDTLVSMGLFKGQELSGEEIAFIEKERETKKAYHQALAYLSYRMRSVAEMRHYLKGKELPPWEIDKVIETLIQENWLNDQHFAEAFIRTKMNTTLNGPGKLKQDLLNKGVSETIARSAIEQYPWDLQLEHAKKLITKKYSKRKRESIQVFKMKTKQFLLQKGFSIDCIEEAISTSDLGEENELEWEALFHQAKKVEKKYQGLEPYEYRQKMKAFLYRKGFKMTDIDRYFNMKGD